MEHKKNRLKLLSVVFSFRNEEDVLPELIRRIRSVLKAEQQKGAIENYELIFVNDASRDKSLEILLTHAREDSNIRIVNMSRRFGVAPCVMAGLEYSSGDAAVYMDADLQDPPEVIADMINVFQTKENVDVIHTVRKSRKGESFLKLFVTKIGYLMLNKATSVSIPREAGDFKLLSRRVVDELLRFKEKKPFMRGLVCWIGFEQEFVFYDRQPRVHGTTKFPVFSLDVINNFLEAAFVSFSSMPLRFASLVGFISIFFSFLLLAHTLHEKISGKAIPGWTAIMIAIIFMGSIQLFCTGIIALYLSSIFEEGKKRPNFIVASTYGFSQNNSAPKASTPAGYSRAEIT